MAEQTFRSPGFFEQEIDLSARKQSPTGTPAGIIGTAQRGPAFVPVTVGSFADFETKFGGLDPDRFGPYAVREFLKHRKAVTYMRVLGAGSNESGTEISNTQTFGIVKNAGFAIQANDGVDSGLVDGAGPLASMPGTDASADDLQGGMQFLVARHTVRPRESEGYPVFTDNDSFADSALGTVNLVRASIMMASGSRLIVGGQVSPGDVSVDRLMTADELEFGDGAGYTMTDQLVTPNDDGIFKLIISSSAGASFGLDDGYPGLRILSASLNPTSPAYIGKILNTDPARFQEFEHVLWCDYAVEDELAMAGLEFSEDLDGTADGTDDSTSIAMVDSIALLYGSQEQTDDSDISDTLGTLQSEWLQLFGRFDTRYKTATTPMFISQPYGATEYDLFRLEALDDGAYPNTRFKASITNLRASTDPNYEYGTFEVQIRRFGDTDLDKQVIEAYPDCNLDPDSDRYVARQIGDYKVTFDFDAEDGDERRLVIGGKYPNRSAVARVVMNPQIDGRDSCIPKDMLPFGFKGIPVLNANPNLIDNTASGRLQLWDDSGSAITTGEDVLSSLVPPLPLRFKCTRGNVSAGVDPLIPLDQGFVGDLGANERADSRFYWGVKFERCPNAGESGDAAALNTNVSTSPNPLVKAYTKFQGISELGATTNAADSDTLCNNRFSLARVALPDVHDQASVLESINTNVIDPASIHMRSAAYMRNAAIDESDYTIEDSLLSGEQSRLTLASLLHNNKITFNRFSDWAKFSTVFYGGFDGLNILDPDVALMNDRASSTDTGETDSGNVIEGKATEGWTDDGLVHFGDAPADADGTVGSTGGDGEVTNTNGSGKRNNVVASYRAAVEMMTDTMTVNTNILCIPGIRDQFVTDLAAERTRQYSKAIYLMDIPYYDENQGRIFLGEPTQDTKKADVQYTAETFEGRAFDNNYCASYFPDVWIDDPINNLKVRVPASIAALASLAFNDKVAYPWFAPAGFNRGALEMVSNVTTRLTAGDRDTLYDSRINPIAVFPNAGFVIFGQKTLQMQKSALDRVNVRRMLLEVKRLVVSVANNILFEPNTPQTRARFVGAVTPLLALVQAQAGIESFQVVMDDTNNTIEDYESNRLNGRIVVVPTRAIEFIAIDFIITRSGVMFE
jgi:hypothetical protein